FGQLTIQPGPKGGYLMNSSFDIWTEQSVDGGTTWTPMTNAAHMVLTNTTPEVFAPTNNLPILYGRYRSPSNFVVAYANGVRISNIVHWGFTTNQPPPPLHSNVVHSFNSQVDFQVSLNGGEKYSQ